MIALALFVCFVIDSCGSDKLISLIKCELTWTLVSNLIALVSVIVAVRTYVHSEKTRKRQATFDAYNEFKNEVFDLENEILSYDIDKIVCAKRKAARGQATPIVNNKWERIKNSLAKTERIATCVNNGIFDAQTIYNMGGPFMIEMFERLYPVIKYKRNKDSRNGIYEEFERMVDNLKKLNRSHRDFK